MRQAIFIFLLFALSVSVFAANPNADGRATGPSDPAAAGNMTYGQCVSENAVIKNTCYAAVKEARTACVEAAKNATKADSKQCVATYKRDLKDCKADFKSAKRSCAQSYKPGFFEKMRYSMT